MVIKLNKEHLDLLNKTFKNDVKILDKLQGGMMNETVVFSSGNKKYVFYSPTKQANEMVNRKIEKETQDIAESLSLTRHSVYFNVKEGTKITEYIEGKSLNHLKFFSYKKVAKLLFDLHSSKQKCSLDYNPLSKLENYKKEASKYAKFCEEFNELYSYIMNVKNFLLKHKKTLAHNDAQRSNIIKSKNGHYYLIDFEFSMNNDPVYDLATFGNDSVKEGLRLVKAYKKLSSLPNIEKRYLLWRIDISLQWYLVALIKHYRGEGNTHNINFLDVADHFLKNALEARKLIK